MKKLKILLLALAATISVGAWAQDEWTDMTSKITNPSFEVDEGSTDLKDVKMDVTGWTKTQDDPEYSQWGAAKSNCVIQGIADAMPTSDGGNYYYIRCNWNADVNYGISQSIAELPVGMYKLTYKAATYSSSWNNSKHTVSLIESDGATSMKTMYSTGANWTNFETYIYKSSATSTLTIKVNMLAGAAVGGHHYQLLVDDFKLYYCEDVNASESNPVDFTGYLSNPTIFNTNTDFVPRGWTAGARTIGNSHYTEGTNDTQLEAWSGGSMNFDYYQTITGLPNGLYTISAKCHDTDSRGGILYAKTGDATKTANMTTDYSTITTDKISVGNGSLQIGIKVDKTTGGSWITGDDFVLKFYGFDATEALATLAKLIESAPTGKHSKATSEALNTAINAAQELVTAGSGTKTEIETAYSNLETAIANANTSIAVYASIKKWYDDAKANLSDEGYNKFVEETSAIKSAYDDGTITDGVEENATLKSKYEEFIKIYYAPGADITDIYIKNAKLLNGQEGWNCNPNTYSDNFAAQNNGNIGVLEFYAGYGSLSLNKYEMLQTLRLPAGEYKLSSNAFFRQGEKFNTDKTKSLAYMKCGNDQTLLPTLGSVEGLGSYANNRGEAISAFENGLYETSTTFKLLESSDVTVGYVGTFDEPKSWFISGPLKLVYVGPVSLVGYIDDISATLTKVPKDKMEKTLQEALNAAVETAKEILAKYDADPTSVTAKEANDACEALKVAINNAEPSIKVYKSVKDAADAAAVKAEALDTDGQKKFDELIEDVMTAYEAGTITDGVAELAAINSALVDATKAQTSVGSDWSILGSNLKDDWAGASGTYQTGVELYTGDNTPAEAKVLLSQTIEGLMPNAKYEVKFYAAANVARNLSPENYGDGIAYVFANNEKKDIPVGQLSTSSFTTDEYLRTFVAAVGEDGKLEFGLGNNKAGGQWYVAQFTSLILKALPSSFDATLTQIGDAAYSTMYLDFPVEIPENVEAYYVTVSGKTATMNAIEGVIPANCGVVLKAAADVEKVTFTQTSTEATTDVSSNVLIGFLEDTEVDNGKAHYAFSYKGDNVAFYIPASAESDTDPTSKFTAKAHKAYIELEGTPSAKLDITWGGEVTGINTIDNGQLTIGNSKAYNLNGMRVSEAYKGIVLKGGKKFLQK